MTLSVFALYLGMLVSALNDGFSATAPMPVPGFLASFADKAQNAINASSLASHQQNPDGSLGSTIDSISNQLRVIGHQYSSSTPPVQKIITAEKAVALDFDSLSRKSKYQSKELYTWGRSESDDLKDVTDRLAYLNFVEGSLAGSVAQKLNTARAPLKALRDAETALAPRRTYRANLYNQIGRLEHDQLKGSERKLAELRDLLKKAELDDQVHEREIEILKRKAVRESESAKWEAIREYGEKLILISQAAKPVIAALPAVPPSPTSPYTGAQATAVARSSLQRALENYKTGHISLPTQSASDLDRSDTRSFGESHASELSHIDVPHSIIPNTPPTVAQPIHQLEPQLPSIPDKAGSPPINPSNLNQSPAPATSVDSSQQPTFVPAISPTVAETGIPVSADLDGSGTTSGSILGTTSGGALTSAPELSEEGKGESPSVSSDVAASERRESAEEEKKRLEREERQRILRGGGSTAQEKGDEELPPYKELE